MSGSATRKPLPSTTYALPLSPILIRDTTSQMNLRLTSAIVTGPVSPPDRTAIVMYGSVSLRKYTGPNHVWPGFASRNAGSCERSLPELAVSMPRRDTRNLLAPVGVELRDVGDLRRLAQQLQELDAPQLDVAGVELRQRRVAQLLLDLADVLLDPRRRGDRLFVLQAGERGLLLLVREVDADRARHEQRAGDERQDQPEVLAEQPATRRRDRPERVGRNRVGRLHWIISCQRSSVRVTTSVTSGDRPGALAMRTVPPPSGRARAARESASTG